MSGERVTETAEAGRMGGVGPPARNLPRVRSSISVGGVSSMNWTSGSIAAGYLTRLGIGIVDSPLARSCCLTDFTLSVDEVPLPGFAGDPRAWWAQYQRRREK